MNMCCIPFVFGFFFYAEAMYGTREPMCSNFLFDKKNCTLWLLADI